MNFGMIQALVDDRIGAIRHQAAPPRASAPGRGPRPATGRAGLRSRAGFALVEVGLHLQATARPGRGRRMWLNERSY